MAALRRVGLAVSLALTWPSTAGATWSIAAVDPQTGQVGVSVASCVEAPYGTTLLPQVPALAPGIGALVAQAQFSQQTRDQALALLLDGTAPQDVVDMVVEGDGLASVRQYGVIDLRLRTAQFTGSATSDWAGHVASETVIAQGNILYGPEVVDDALAAFEAASRECPWTLADRLLVALEAGSAQGGDNRCSEEQSALAAVLLVANPGDPVDAPFLDLRIPSQREGGDNPVVLLRQAYDAWRRANPPDASRCEGDTTSSGDDTSGASPPPASTSSGDGTTTSGGETGPPAPPPAEPTTTTASDATTSGGASASGDERGCACTHRDGAPWAWAWIGLLAFALRRRARL